MLRVKQGRCLAAASRRKEIKIWNDEKVALCSLVKWEAIKTARRVLAR